MLVVDFAELQSAIGHLVRFHRAVTECLRDADRCMGTLRATWHGEASDAQANAQRQWEDGADRMRTALSELQKVAESAHANYSDAVGKNGQMWA